MSQTTLLCGHRWFQALALMVALVSQCALANLHPPLGQQAFAASVHNPWHFPPCKWNWDCVDSHGQELQNVVCKENMCKCIVGYEPDHTISLHAPTLKCVKSKHCLFNFECGDNSYCHQGRCLCHLGYSRKGNENDCHEKTCYEHSECYSWANTKCDLLGRCVCKEGYDNYKSESCQKIEAPSYSYNFLAQNVFTIVIISNFLLWLSIFIFILQYAKKRRLAAAEAASSSMRRTLPPGMPPPPPAYDNIGFESGPSYPPPPPYSPTDAAKHTVSPAIDPPVVSVIVAQNIAEQQQSPHSSAMQPVPSSASSSSVTSHQPISHISE